MCGIYVGILYFDEEGRVKLKRWRKESRRLPLHIWSLIQKL